jgi:hypothetical protein
MSIGLMAAGRATAGPLALFTSSGTGTIRTGDGFTLGGQFTVGSQNAVVSSLGVFDSTGSSLAAATPVDIWDSSQNVVASAIVPQGTTDANQFSYVAITPVTLLAGQTYTIGAYYSSSADPAQLHDHSASPGQSPDFNNYTARFSSSASAGVITIPTGGAGSGVYLGPNMIYTVPEPATLWLSGAGLLMLLCRHRLGRRHR